MLSDTEMINSNHLGNNKSSSAYIKSRRDQSDKTGEWSVSKQS
jgi:hypothetical protein